jgi:hypothetical protein
LLPSRSFTRSLKDVDKRSKDGMTSDEHPCIMYSYI